MSDRGRETKPNRSNCSRDDDYTPKEIKYDSTSSNKDVPWKTNK